MHIAKQLSTEEAEQCIDFLKCCDKAFGRDVAYQRLWGGLNLTLCGWLFRRMVITPYGPKTYRATREMFSKCLMSLSADSTYIDWLLARKLSDRDRSPAYARIRAAFVKRIEAETGVKPYMPAPNWAHHLSRRSPSMTTPSSNGVF